jgi:Protein of unknown function (DUF2934)
MTAKRASNPGRRTEKSKAKTKTHEPGLAESAVLVILESPQSSTADHVSIDLEMRRQLIAAEAYFRAERRGFAAGHELSDWLAAEADVDSRLNKMQVA